MTKPKPEVARWRAHGDRMFLDYPTRSEWAGLIGVPFTRVVIRCMVIEEEHKVKLYEPSEIARLTGATVQEISTLLAACQYAVVRLQELAQLAAERDPVLL